MPNCFRCGREVPSSRHQLRRKVKTGEWLRRTYSKGKVSSVNVHFGLRVVCKTCARSIDREARKAELLQFWELGLALVVLALLLLLKALG